MNDPNWQGRAIQLSVWAECRCAGMLARLMEREGADAAVAPRLAAHVGWSLGKTVSRLGIDRRIPAAVLYWAGVEDRAMDRLPLARLLDVARKRSLREKAICLAYAVHGRRPRWADAA